MTSTKTSLTKPNAQTTSHTHTNRDPNNHSARIGLTLTATTLTATAALTLPFLRRFTGAPYVTSTPAARKAIIRAIQQQQQQNIPSSITTTLPSLSPPKTTIQRNIPHVIDLGSGSGDLLLQLKAIGIRTTGYDLNPWLILLSRYRALLSSSSRHNKSSPSQHREAIATFYWADMWKAPLDDATAVVVFGIPDIMRRIGTKVARDAPNGCLLCCNTFPVPGWRHVAYSGGVWFYRIGESNVAKQTKENE